MHHERRGHVDGVRLEHGAQLQVDQLQRVNLVLGLSAQAAFLVRITAPVDRHLLGDVGAVRTIWNDTLKAMFTNQETIEAVQKVVDSGDLAALRQIFS